MTTILLLLLLSSSSIFCRGDLYLSFLAVIYVLRFLFHYPFSTAHIFLIFFTKSSFYLSYLGLAFSRRSVYFARLCYWCISLSYLLLLFVPLPHLLHYCFLKANLNIVFMTDWMILFHFTSYKFFRYKYLVFLFCDQYSNQSLRERTVSLLWYKVACHV